MNRIIDWRINIKGRIIWFRGLRQGSESRMNFDYQRMNIKDLRMQFEIQN
ncbi:MAG: hypothetical protein ABRQ27_14260 [Clostridiaceae bacterium]